MELIQIFEEIKKGVPDWVQEAREEHIKLDVHFNNIGTADYLTKIDELENDNQIRLRKKYFTSNRYLFANLSRPIDKVFSARGGNRIIPDTSKQLKKKVNKFSGHLPLRKWISNIQANKCYTDPAGLVFLEVKDGDTYPTLKSINSIFSYKQNGREVEWVIFEPFKVEGEEGQFYRVVDEKLDRIVNVTKDKIIEVKELNGEKQIFKNPFGKVPAIINSDIVSPNLQYNESPFEDVIDLADHYLRTGTIKNLNEFLHGFPLFWRYVTTCKECNGTGLINGKKCPFCNGTGKALNKSITDIIQIEFPDADEAKVAPNLAGYIVPPLASWQEMRTELDWLTTLMELTLWGSKLSKDTNNETATAAFLNVQPANDRLNQFADTFENLEQEIVDLLAIFYKEKTGSISYGRRFLVESADVIWDKYIKAREQGVSKVILDYLLKQYYQTEYANDIESLVMLEKELELETFVHKTDEEVNNLPILEEDKLRKFYFHDWFKSLTEVELLKDNKTLKEQFNNYIKQKNENRKQEIQRVQSNL